MDASADLAIRLTLGVLGIGLGLKLAPWRRPPLTDPWPERPARRVPVIVPLLLGLLASAVCAMLLRDDDAVASLAAVVALFAPSAVLALRSDLGAKAFGVSTVMGGTETAVHWWLRALPLLYGLSLLATLVAQWHGVQPTGSAEEIFVAAQREERLFVALLGVLLVPPLEEIFFRGRLLAALTRVMGPRWGNLVQAVLFGLAHGPVAALPVGVLGWLLGRARLAGTGLGALSVVHAVHNAVAFALLAALHGG